MNIKRAFLVMAAALLMPGLAMAGHSVGPGDMTFLVDIDFTPDSANMTDVKIDCENVETPPTAVRTDPDQEEGDQSQFDYATTTLETAVCKVTVEPVPGWDVTYSATSSGGPVSLIGGCTFGPPIFEVAEGNNECLASFTVSDEDFTLCKEWALGSGGGDETDIGDYTLEIACEVGSILESNLYDVLGPSSDCDGLSTCDFVLFPQSGSSSVCVSVDVAPPTECRGFEFGIDNSSVTSSGCESYQLVSINDNESCTIINTSFFEGIPTLNQYGLALLALLMLGVGFVGFRRFV